VTVTSVPPVERGAPRLRGALLLFSAAHFSDHLCTALLVPLLPFIRDYFGLSYFQSGLLITAYSVTAGFANLPMGWLADRLGMRWVLALGLLGVGVATVALGASAGYYQALLSAILVGLFSGAYHPVSAALLGGYAGRRQRGRSLGAHMVGGSLGHTLAPVLGGAVAGLLGWRSAFYLLAVPVLVMAPVLLGRSQRYEATAREVEPLPVGTPSLARSLRPVALVLAFSVAMGLIVMGATSLLPIYLVDRHRVLPAYASMVIAVLRGAGVISALAGGVLADRLGRLPTIVASLVAAGPLLYLVAVLPFGAGLILAMLFLGAAIMLRQPAMQSLLVDVVPPGQRSSLLGVYFFLSAEGRSLMVPLVGYLMDAFGLGQTFTGLGVVAVVLSVMALALRRRL